MSLDPFATVYVGGLADATTADVLGELFGQIGPVTSVKRVEGKSFAFVQFGGEDPLASVLYAIRVLDGLRVDGRAISVQPRNSAPGVDPALQSILHDPYYQFE